MDRIECKGGRSSIDGSVPWKYIGAGVVFFAASMYGLVVIVAKFLKIELPWPF